MNISKRVLHFGLVLGFSLCSMSSRADFFEGDPVPEIQAQDIFGKSVNLNEILEKNPDLVILFFFTPDNGKAIAAKLQALKRLYNSDALSIIALGMESDKAALQAFADGLKIQYFLLADEQVKTAEWYKNVNQLPLTLFVHTPERKIERVLRGAGTEQANILKQVAENLFQQRKTDKASAVVASALENGEDAKEVKELNGHILVAEGKLDEAEKEFGEIGADAGLAKVALERGDLEGAIAAADKAGDDGYAQAVKGEALIKSGQLEQAETSLAAAASAEIPEWQKSEAVNAQGRLAQANGDIDKAVEQYAKAQSLDQYNVEALSNEGAAYRERGGENDLALAKETLEKASAIRPDEMTNLMLQQVRTELEEANDIKKGELIKSLITDLSKRYEELKAKGEAEPADDWTSRPVVLAFLPGETKGKIVFDRAGTDMVLQREIEVQAQGKNGIQVVERVMLDKLLQELNLGSSELASGDTQRRLGQVLSAGHLGFIDFAQVGADTMLYLRLIDSETTGIFFQASQKIDDSRPTETVAAVVNALTEKLASTEPLQGLIADAAANDAVIINLGKKHGAKEGLEFKILQDGAPIEVGGKVIAHRQKPVGKLTLTTVEEDYAIGTASNLAEGVTLAKEMKIQQLK
ncbi:MAG: redoxin domain-containing protein [Candidatus Hydrogenedentes bacterium]|nr:redoxin domain-containing protein [Candidatus Hydrogenedentota bacterium]